MKKRILFAALLVGVTSVNTSINAIGLSTITTPIKISLKEAGAIILVGGVGVGLVLIGGGGLMCMEEPRAAVAIPLGVVTTVLCLHYSLLLSKSALKDILNYNEKNNKLPSSSDKLDT